VTPRRRSAAIRTLRPGERVPETEPRRYSNDKGYIRLRWLVGTQRYVETFEHRVFDGFVTTAEHVHHRNEVKWDNRLENRQPMTRREHGLHHKRPRMWTPFRSQEAMLKAAYAENRRRDRARRTERMRKLIAQGRTTIEIGQLLGVHHSAVSRYARTGRNW
jgi:hypothetical protein